jgi:transposase
LDEVGFSVAMRARRGRSLRGTRAVQTVPALRTRNISVCCTMNIAGIYYYSAQTRPYNGVFFVAYIRNLLEKLAADNIVGAMLIMDNVAFHRSAQVGALVEASGHRLLFLAPYSPFLNPIENMFAKWKEFVRRENAENEEILIRLIENGARLISEHDCAAFYMHMVTFLDKCRNMEEIVDE